MKRYLVILIGFNILTSCMPASNTSSLYPIKKNGLYSYIDKLGMEKYEDKYLYASRYVDNYAIVETLDKKVGVLNLDGEIIIIDNAQRGKEFSDGLAQILINNKWGYIDTSGHLIIQPQYAEASRFSEGLAVVKDNTEKKIKGYCFINKKNEIVFTAGYSFALPFSEGFALVERDDKLCFLKQDGGLLQIDQNLVDGMSFSNDLAAVSIIKNDSNLWGYVDRSGEFIIKPEYQYADSFFDGYAVVKREDKYLVINKNNSVLFFLNADVAYSPHEGMIRIKKNDKWWFVNMDGEIVNDEGFMWCDDFTNGMAIIEKQEVTENGTLQVSGCIFLDGRVVWGR